MNVSSPLPNFYLSEVEVALVADRAAQTSSRPFPADLREQASAALKEYFSFRADALKIIEHAESPNSFDPDLVAFYREQINRALTQRNSINRPLSEKCDALYRLTTSIDLYIADADLNAIEKLPEYDDEVSLAALDGLVTDLANRFAVLNCSCCDLSKFSRKLFPESAEKLAQIFVDDSSENIMTTALAIHELAAEGQLTGIHSDVSLDEVVRMVAVSTDLDKILKAQTRGEVVAGICALFALLLLLGTALWAVCVVSPALWKLALIFAQPSLKILFAVASVALTVFTGVSVFNFFVDNEGPETQHLLDSFRSFGRFITLILPAKMHAWLTAVHDANHATAKAKMPNHATAKAKALNAIEADTVAESAF